MLESEIDEGINVCCVIADSLRWDTFVDADSVNILKLGKARRGYSVGNSTSTSIHGYLLNHPPIGVGRGFFVHGKPREVHYKAPKTARERGRYGGLALRKVDDPVLIQPSNLRKWMPKYFMEHGYFTMWMSPSPIMMLVDKELGGAYRKNFNYWGTDEYYDMPVGTATPQIIRDLDLQVKMNRDQPIFAVILLLDTHSPYHDGSGETHIMDSSSPQVNYGHQVEAMKYVDNVFPNFVNIFAKTGRPTEFIFTSDHGENFGGEPGTAEQRGWGHSSFRAGLKFGEELFAIPFMRGRIDDWSKFKVHVVDE